MSAPGLVSEISAAAISALPFRATCHVPEVFFCHPLLHHAVRRPRWVVPVARAVVAPASRRGGPSWGDLAGARIGYAVLRRARSARAGSARAGPRRLHRAVPDPG